MNFFFILSTYSTNFFITQEKYYLSFKTTVAEALRIVY